MIYLQRLVIRNNKVIQDLTLDFNELKPMTVFIGENGSGKTTVLESLTAIFAALHQRVEGLKVVAPAFDFELIYLLSGENVLEETTTTKMSATIYIEVQVRGSMHQPNSISVLIGNDKDLLLTKDLLPNLVIYYPGSSDTLLHTYQYFTEEQEKRLRVKAKSSSDAYSRIKDLPVFYYQKQHFDMLLASLMAFQYSDDINDFFAKKLQISAVDHVPITMFIEHLNQSKKGIGSYYWGAEGDVKLFLDLIRECADGEAGKGEQFNFSREAWFRLREYYADEKTLFLMLNMLDVSGFLKGFNIAFKRSENLFPHFFLSEGERQLIVTKGLAELLFDDHTLFLLDEPNVFMHPSWQSSFMEDLQAYTERASFIITTHSPIILSTIRDGHLIRMVAGQADSIEGHYYGREYSDNLEDQMGTPARIPAMAIKLRSLFDLIDDELYEEAAIKLNDLRQTLGDNDSDLNRAQAMLNFYR